MLMSIKSEFVALAALCLLATPAAAKAHHTPAAPVQAAPAEPMPDLSGTDPHWVHDAKSDCWLYAEHLVPNLTSSWDGSCKDHLLEGQGTLTWIGGTKDIATGLFHRGKLNGPAKLDLGDVHIEGNFLGNHLEGAGKITDNTGASYVGSFHDGQFDGAGTWIVTKGSVKNYTGGFKRGLPDGTGTINFTNGGSYTGSFIGGRFEGHGVRNLADGISIEGTFYSGLPSSEVIYRAPEGTVLKGVIEKPKHDPDNPMANPEYPAQAVRQAHQSITLVTVVIGLDGKAKYAWIDRTSGYPELDAAALASTSAWHMIPGTVGGTPVEMEYTKQVIFHLSQ
jgi:TonB family protein